MIRGDEIEDKNEEQISVFLSLIYEALFSSRIKAHFTQSNGESNSANMATNDTEPRQEDIVYIESKKHQLHFES